MMKRLISFTITTLLVLSSLLGANAAGSYFMSERTFTTEFRTAKPMSTAMGARIGI